MRMTTVSLRENILDFRSAEQEWKRISEAREAAQHEYLTAPAQNPIRREVPHAMGLDLSFMFDVKLREIVGRDYSELQMAKRASASKTRLILSGGLIEALLLDALERNEKSALKANAAEADNKGKGKVKALDDWNLSSLIDVAAELSLISEGSAKLSNVIRDFRNLVHAGKERRGDYVIEEHEAQAAEAGLSAEGLGTKAKVKDCKPDSSDAPQSREHSPWANSRAVYVAQAHFLNLFWAHFFRFWGHKRSMYNSASLNGGYTCEYCSYKYDRCRLLRSDEAPRDYRESRLSTER